MDGAGGVGFEPLLQGDVARESLFLCCGVSSDDVFDHLGILHNSVA